jgi:hypothetical protein
MLNRSFKASKTILVLNFDLYLPSADRFSSGYYSKFKFNKSNLTYCPDFWGTITLW